MGEIGDRDIAVEPGRAILSAAVLAIVVIAGGKNIRNARLP
jgi:hypothetical protein